MPYLMKISHFNHLFTHYTVVWSADHTTIFPGSPASDSLKNGLILKRTLIAVEGKDMKVGSWYLNEISSRAYGIFKDLPFRTHHYFLRGNNYKYKPKVNFTKSQYNNDFKKLPKNSSLFHLKYKQAKQKVVNSSYQLYPRSQYHTM